MTTERLPYIEFISVTVTTSVEFLFRPPPLSYVSNIYYLPFDIVVWICALILVVVSTTIIYITYRFNKGSGEQITLSDFFLYAVGTICQMGSHQVAKKSSGKIATV